MVFADAATPQRDDFIDPHDIDETLFLSDVVYLLGSYPAKIVYRLEVTKFAGEDYLFAKEYL